MRKSTKKGFTIVELVIVIAVIAILAAVLIPTFTGIIRKARESTDIQLVRSLNTAVATAKALDGKNATMHEAVADAFDAGYDLDKIKAEAKNNRIVWDSVNDVFCYYDADEDDIKYLPEQEIGEDIPDDQYWIISDAISNKYSTYLNNGFTVPTDGVVTTTVGLDVGNVKGIKEIWYENLGAGKNVIFRTYGGTLYINAPKDTVFHYGASEVIDITAVATASFHEFGSVGYTKIAAGRYVAEATAEINTLVATAVNGVALETKTAAITQVVTPIVAEGAPKLQLVVADGAAADVAAKLEEVAVVEIDTSNSENLKANLANIQAGATMFVCGSGTKDNPYLIATKEHMQNIGKKADTYSYYQVIAEEIDCSTWTPVDFYGNFDGNGVVLNNLDKRLFYTVEYGNGETQTIKNMTLNCRIVDTYAAALCRNCQGNVVFENIDVNGYIEGAGNDSVYVAFGSWGDANTVRFVDCGGSATLVAKARQSGIYVGHRGTKTSVVLEDCNYSGTVYTLSGSSYVTADYTTSSWAAFKEVIDGVEQPQVEYGKKYVNTLQLSRKEIDASEKTIGEAFVVDVAPNNSTYAVAEFWIGPDGNGTTVMGPNYSGVYMSEKLTSNAGKYTTKDIKSCNIAINAAGATETGLDGTTFNIVNAKYGNTYTSASVSITEYDTNNNIVAITVFVIKKP